MQDCIPHNTNYLTIPNLNLYTREVLIPTLRPRLCGMRTNIRGLHAALVQFFPEFAGNLAAAEKLLTVVVVFLTYCNSLQDVEDPKKAWHVCLMVCHARVTYPSMSKYRYGGNYTLVDPSHA